jgi:hypothetical protein
VPSALILEMVASASGDELPSMLSTTIRRSIVFGRLFIVGGMAYVIVLTLVEAYSSQADLDSATPLLLPIFGVLGSMGALTAFTNDRVKGVFEYLVAYGVRPRTIFANSLIASLVVTTLTLGVGVAFVLGASLLFFGTVSWSLTEFLAIYSVPMCYASAGFASQVGMYFTAFSSPRGGISSPIGIIPLVGIAPSLLTLIAVGIVAAEFGTSAIYLLMAIAVVIVVAISLALLALVGRLLRLERLLSPA